MKKNTSVHILNTSTNLLGFCLIVMTALRVTNKDELTYIDEATSIISIFLAFSSILSFIALKSNNDRVGEKLEGIADYLFLTALLGVVGVIVIIALNYLVK